MDGAPVAGAFPFFVMDEHYLLATVRHTELNPVRANLCERPEDWEWSSVHAQLRILKPGPKADTQ